MLRTLSALIVLAPLALSTGCTAPGAGGGSVMALSGLGDEASYESAFQSARDELRDRGYLLERVDSSAGVITTQRTGLPREVEDVLHRQRHYVRVTFSPPAEDTGPDSAAMASGSAGGRVMSVRVIVERVQRPGWRVPTNSVRLASTSADTTLDERGLRPVYAVPIEEDTDSAREIASAISRRAGTK